MVCPSLTALQQSVMIHSAASRHECLQRRAAALLKPYHEWRIWDIKSGCNIVLQRIFRTSEDIEVFVFLFRGVRHTKRKLEDRHRIHSGSRVDLVMLLGCGHSFGRRLVAIAGELDPRTWLGSFSLQFMCFFFNVAPHMCMWIGLFVLFKFWINVGLVHISQMVWDAWVVMICYVGGISHQGPFGESGIIANYRKNMVPFVSLGVGRDIQHQLHA